MTIATAQDTENLIRMLSSNEPTSIELAFTIMSGLQLDLTDPVFKCEFENLLNQNYLNKHLATINGFGKHIRVNRFSENLFKELSQKLPSSFFDNSSQSRNQVLKLWVQTYQNVNTIDVRSSQLTELPEEIYELKNLKKLMICGNKIRGFSPKIAQLTALEEIGFCYMAENFYIPPEIGALKETLKSACIDLSDYAYSGIESVDKLQQLLPKTKLH